MNVSNYQGTAGDSLSIHHSGMMFSTNDEDNDITSSINCAHKYKGAWWYGLCFNSNLNGFNTGNDATYIGAMSWRTFGGHYHPLKSVYMAIRPMNAD